MIKPRGFLGGKVELFGGDCREVIRQMPDNSIDAVCTDPPYALVSIAKRFGNSNPADVEKNALARKIKGQGTSPHGRAAAGFMGKKWDTGEAAFAVEFWAEVFRVLKPGGYVLAFGGTRTYHRLACAVEDAGFEIRDQVKFAHESGTDGAAFLASLNDEQRAQFLKLLEADELGQLSWAYGSGFPKSHNVSKGMAKRRVEDVEPVRVVCRVIRAAMDRKGLKSKDLTAHFDDCNPRLIDHWAARDTDSQPSLPTPDQWRVLAHILDLRGDDGFAEIDREVARLNDRKGTHGERWLSAEVVGEITVDSPGFGAEHRFTGDRSIRALDDEAAKWEGWGTALKPAWEPIVMARKPLIGTIVENVLEHGTGAINVDGARIHADDAKAQAYTVKRTAPGATQNATGERKFADVVYEGETKDGRWPANIVHDGSDEVVGAFPEAGGAFAPVTGKEPTGHGFSGNVYGAPGKQGRQGSDQRDGGGSAARFFYSAKADAGDRLGSKHPTVKPVDLMRWLVRLVTPPGGVVLDPFAGTGSTGEAAYLEGFRAVLIEREEEYQADIARRFELVGHPTRRAAVAKSKNKLQGAEGTPLFGDEGESDAET